MTIELPDKLAQTSLAAAAGCLLLIGALPSAGHIVW